jgi:hypothetical protein
LKDALEKVSSGDLIQLCEAIYDGPYLMENKNQITIQGLGQTMFIINSEIFKICGSHCTIKNLSIHSTWISPPGFKEWPNLFMAGNNNNLSNISISGGKVGCFIAGNRNILHHVSFTNSAVTSLQLTGNFNKVSNTGFTLAGRGCKMIGNDNDFVHLLWIFQ